MHQAITSNSKPARFNELAFYDNVTGALRAALGIIECAADSARAADQLALSDALGVAGEKLDQIAQDMGDWDADRIARAKAEQVKVEAAKMVCGVGEPVPLTRETRKRIQEILDQSVELKVAKAKGRRAAKGGRK